MADNTFTHLVLVGSSAGGLGALSGMVSSLPEDFDAPIVVSQHLDPDRESHLQEILARKSLLPVKTVSEHEPLQAGVVYVVLANWHVNITDLEIELRAIPVPAHAFHKPPHEDRGKSLRGEPHRRRAQRYGHGWNRGRAPSARPVARRSERSKATASRAVC